MAWDKIQLQPSLLLLITGVMAITLLMQSIIGRGLDAQLREPENLDATILYKKRKIIEVRNKAQTVPVWHGPVEPLNIPAGSTPVIYDIPTSQPVVFLTIDDGWTKTSETQKWLLEHKLPATLFLINDAIKNNYDYFKSLQNAGMSIEDHTLTHPNLAKLRLARQQAQICGAADTYQDVFGHRPTLLRPPYGSFNAATIHAASSCGMQAIVMWRVVISKGVIYFQGDRTQLEPGDIVLMHFRPEFLDDVKDFVSETNRAHLQIGHLEDWLQ
jgi:peptidoglycan/xylan/chitin deacetylase (PgdA/CDA1 family)